MLLRRGEGGKRDYFCAITSRRCWNFSRNRNQIPEFTERSATSGKKQRTFKKPFSQRGICRFRGCPAKPSISPHTASVATTTIFFPCRRTDGESRSEMCVARESVPPYSWRVFKHHSGLRQCMTIRIFPR